MPGQTTPWLKEYETAYETAAIYPIPRPGCLFIHGRDQIDFLNRQTTNDLNSLSSGQTRTTTLLSPTARILDVFQVLAMDEGLLCLTLPGNADSTAAYLSSRIFFMDQVQVEDHSQAYNQIELLGPRAVDALAALGLEAAPSPEQYASIPIEDRLLLVLPSSGWGVPAYRILAPIEIMDQTRMTLAASGGSRLSEPAFEALRIEVGLPAAGAELTADFTPLEVGLRDTIHDHKGCYTGQEVIARQITYDKVTRQMCGLASEAILQPGMQLWSEGKSAGQVTSSAISPRYGPIALAVVRRPHNQPGTRLACGVDTDTAIQTVTVMKLPFSSKEE